jgi:hypothetical protein
MGQKFNTVDEVTSWDNFTLDGEIYDLSHLDAHSVEYFDNRDDKNTITYKFIITYGFHCFTGKSDEVDRSLIYNAPKESRAFNVERYHLSKYLPDLVKALAEKTSLVIHAGYGNYATAKVLDSNNIEVDYFVAFKVFRESKKLRLHILSAYPKYEGLGKIKKVSFLVIASNLLRNKKLPTP